MHSCNVHRRGDGLHFAVPSTFGMLSAQRAHMKLDHGCHSPACTAVGDKTTDSRVVNSVAPFFLHRGIYILKSDTLVALKELIVLEYLARRD